MNVGRGKLLFTFLYEYDGNGYEWRVLTSE